jgi:hypothetical protein
MTVVVVVFVVVAVVVAFVAGAADGRMILAEGRSRARRGRHPRPGGLWLYFSESGCCCRHVLEKFDFSCSLLIASAGQERRRRRCSLTHKGRPSGCQPCHARSLRIHTLPAQRSAQARERDRERATKAKRSLQSQVVAVVAAAVSGRREQAPPTSWWSLKGRGVARVSCWSLARPSGVIARVIVTSHGVSVTS